ncbi:hypothetical protein PR202_ga04660 [Eleusine coracana subsp. coracana]|uniref:Uncharacterized protein n=1 Tax=Eleusine coracana subsp. coracana TaxID=191504 RepID=A0AAV5BRS1_ELECO|nr:hypothetical protein PR202_ga04660 [Eleusine coracana subsp. coracana]
MAEDGSGEKKDVAVAKHAKRQGGFRTMPFILANDFCDRLATVGFGSNLISYLTLQLHLPLRGGSNIIQQLPRHGKPWTRSSALIADSSRGFGSGHHVRLP